MAMVASGIALGVLGSRLLPPLLAIGAGAIKSKTGGDPFGKLKDDHRIILGTLSAMEQSEDGSIAKRMPKFLMLKRKLAKHALAEEDVVYPLLNDEAQRQEAAKHLYEEHAEMKILLFEIEAAVMHGEPWTQPVRNLREIIERHVREEEDEQFPKLIEVLNEQRLSEMTAQVHREEALIL
jgi:iron-sulfur cluster repair protein YtfE (RIC family)